MIITTLDAKVEQGRWDELRAKFKDMADRIPVQMIQTLLVQNAQDLNAWKLITVWKSREDFAEYRKSSQLMVPEGVALFRSLGVEATPTLLNVAEHSKING